MTDRSADVHKLLKLASEAFRDDAAIRYLIRAVEALAVVLEDHGHPAKINELRVADNRVASIEDELVATKILLAETQKQHYATIADFCTLRDAFPRAQVEQILGSRVALIRRDPYHSDPSDPT